MDRGPWKKWTPAVAATAMIAALAAGGSIAASARTDLPDRTPQELLGMVAGHEVEGFSGRLEAVVELGLPQAPVEDLDDEQAQGAASPDERIAGLLALLGGTHEARVFADGHERLRVQLLEGAEEKNVIRSEDELWFYDSAENRAVHARLPQSWPRDCVPMTRGDHHALPTPEQLADRLLGRAEEHSRISVEEGVSDSGRDAYTLRLDPRTEQTLVEAVTVDVDAETGMPLGVEVLAVGQDTPAVRVAFTEFTPRVPDAALFEFQPPAGAAVEEKSLDGVMHDGMMHDGWQHGPESMMGHGGSGHRGQGFEDHRVGEVIGDGWAAVVVLSADVVPPELTDSALLDELAVDVEEGRLLSTPLLNVLLTDDGRVLAGAVPEQRLQDVAADTAGEG